MKRSFKTEVFLTIPLTFLAFGLVCASFITKEWVSGRSIKVESEDEIVYNYGLFSGHKTRSTTYTKDYNLKGNFEIDF